MFIIQAGHKPFLESRAEGVGQRKRREIKQQQTSRTNTSPRYFDDPSLPVPRRWRWRSRFGTSVSSSTNDPLAVASVQLSCTTQLDIISPLPTPPTSPNPPDPVESPRSPKAPESLKPLPRPPCPCSTSPLEAAWNSPKSPKVSNVESSSSRENDVEKVKGSASLVAAESENGPNPSSCVRLTCKHCVKNRTYEPHSHHLLQSDHPQPTRISEKDRRHPAIRHFTTRGESA